MRLIYAYDSEQYFTKIIEQNIDELTGEYPPVVFGTTQPTPTYNANLEIPKFVNDAWILEDLKESGVFYLKADATELTEIAKKDADLYTTIEPLKKYDDGTTQAFNDATQAWEYTFKGADLLEAERLEALHASKQDSIAQLESDYNESKKITIQNGKTLIIAHDTPERDKFLDLIEKVSNLSTTQGAAFIYEQQTDVGKLALRILPEIAAYIFKDLFIATLANAQQTKVNSRVHNKTTVYELALEKINDATTQAELDLVTWTFLKPAGIVIDVNTEAVKMLNDATVSQFAKDAINASTDPTTGEIHLVKTLQELANDS
jgi:hypothetical protein